MTVFDCDATVWQGGTCVLPVLAAVEGKLGVLVTISWRLKLRPCSRLLAEGAAHRHRGFEWTGPTLWWSQGHNFTNCSQTHPTLLLTWTRWTHTHTHQEHTWMSSPRGEGEGEGQPQTAMAPSADRWRCLLQNVFPSDAALIQDHRSLTSLAEALTRSVYRVRWRCGALAARFPGVRNETCRAGQTAVPWAVAGACTWTGVEDPDTMLKEQEPEDRAPGISDRLPDLQWHTQPAVCFSSRHSECCLAIIPTLQAHHSSVPLHQARLS